MYIVTFSKHINELAAINVAMMKHIAITVFITCFLASCTFEKTDVNKKMHQGNDSSFIDFSNFLNGVWVSTNYVNTLESNKSPFLSRETLSGVVSMIVNRSSQKDSFNILADWDNHCIANFSVFNKSGQAENSFKIKLTDYDVKTNYYELGYLINENDTTLFIYHFNKEKVLLDKKPFFRISEQTFHDEKWGIRHIVNKTLMSGKYIMIDSLNNKSEVTLNSDGSIDGYNKFKTYEVATDYCGWAPWEYSDRICFNVLTDSVKCYNFKIIEDSLKLYELTYDEANMKTQIGSLKYELLKQ